MRNVARIYLSDLHMSSTHALEGERPYGWLTRELVDDVAGFLRSPTVTECQQLFLVGDVVDLWICPHDVRPPTAQEILAAPHNQPIVEAVRAFAALPGRSVVWCRGNHDAAIERADAAALCPGAALRERYDEPPLHVFHGHDRCLFNGPDPTGRPFPLGYVLSRFVATAAARGLHPIGANLHTLLRIGPQLVALLDRVPLAECVFDAVHDRAGLTPERDRDLVMPDGSRVALAALRETYQHLRSEWAAQRTNDPSNAVLCEDDPFYDLPVAPVGLHVAGHSHTHRCASLVTGGGYLNLGAWCTSSEQRAPDRHFARTWVESAGRPDELLCGELGRWRPAVGVDDHSTRLRVPTARAA